MPAQMFQMREPKDPVAGMVQALGWIQGMQNEAKRAVNLDLTNELLGLKVEEAKATQSGSIQAQQSELGYRTAKSQFDTQQITSGTAQRAVDLDMRRADALTRSAEAEASIANERANISLMLGNLDVTAKKLGIKVGEYQFGEEQAQQMNNRRLASYKVSMVESQARSMGLDLLMKTGLFDVEKKKAADQAELMGETLRQLKMNNDNTEERIGIEKKFRKLQEDTTILQGVVANPETKDTVLRHLLDTDPEDPLVRELQDLDPEAARAAQGNPQTYLMLRIAKGDESAIKMFAHQRASQSAMEGFAEAQQMGGMDMFTKQPYSYEARYDAVYSNIVKSTGRLLEKNLGPATVSDTEPSSNNTTKSPKTSFYKETGVDTADRVAYHYSQRPEVANMKLSEISSKSVLTQNKLRADHFADEPAPELPFLSGFGLKSLKSTTDFAASINSLNSGAAWPTAELADNWRKESPVWLQAYKPDPSATVKQDAVYRGLVKSMYLNHTSDLLWEAGKTPGYRGAQEALRSGKFKYTDDDPKELARKVVNSYGKGFFTAKQAENLAALIQAME